MKISQNDYDYIAVFLKKASGIDLGADKSYLVESRVLPIIKKFKLDSFAALIKLLQSGNEFVGAEVIDSLTTNESYFFRDVKPFEALSQLVFPDLKSKNPNRKIHIWSNACSTGQEPYSIVMTVMENKSFSINDFEILATDISPNVIKQAKSGIYSQFEVQRGTPINLLLKYFAKKGVDEWEIIDDAKKHVSFRLFNMMDDFSTISQRDVILCRNVLIYFDSETKKQILEKIAAKLSPNGYLMIGTSENLIGLTDKFEMVKEWPGTYIKKS